MLIDCKKGGVSDFLMYVISSSRYDGQGKVYINITDDVKDVGEYRIRVKSISVGLTKKRDSEWSEYFNVGST